MSYRVTALRMVKSTPPFKMLKDDLDVCAREMKRIVALNNRGALFEGWPSANDEILEA